MVKKFLKSSIAGPPIVLLMRSGRDSHEVAASQEPPAARGYNGFRDRPVKPLLRGSRFAAAPLRKSRIEERTTNSMIRSARIEKNH